MKSTEWQLIEFKEQKLKDYLIEYRAHLKHFSSMLKTETKSALLPGLQDKKDSVLKLKEAC